MKAHFNRKLRLHRESLHYRDGNFRATQNTSLLIEEKSAFVSDKKLVFVSRLLVFLFILFPAILSAQSITVTDVTSGPVCVGDEVTVTFDVINGSAAGEYFSSSTDYQVFLSDAAGNVFTASGSTFNEAASYNTTDGSTVSVTTTFTIPSGTSAGSGYKIAIGSSSPAFDASGGAGASGTFEINSVLPSIVSHTDGNTCGPGPVVLQAAASSVTSTIEWYDGTPGGGPVGSGTSFSTPTINSTKNFYAEAIDGGCRSASRQAVQAIYTPVPTVSVTASAAVSCAGQSVTFTATPTNGGTSPMFQWRINGINQGSLTSSNTFTRSNLSNGDVVSVAMTAGNYCAITPVIGSAPAMTVNARPTVGLTSATSVCGSGNATFTSTPSSGATIHWYDAATNGTDLGTGNNFITSISANTTLYAEAVYNGCSSATRKPATATVKPLPVVTAGSAGVACAGGSTTLTASAFTAGSTITWYTAASGGSNIGTGASIATPNISANTSYYAEATLNGCTSASRFQVDVAVNPLPVLSNVMGDTRCGTGTVNLTAATDKGVINWYYPAGTLVGSGTTYSPSISSTATYYAEADDNGCKSAQQPAIATVNNIPSVSTSTPGSVCGTGSVALSATPSAGATLNWYAASTGGSSLATGNTYNTPSISGTTSYWVDATANGCISGRTEVIATVKPIPTIATTTPAARCGTGVVNLAATASPSTAVLNWYAASTGGASLGTGATFNTPSISSNTTYYVDATENGCTSSRTAVLATVNAVPTVTSVTANDICVSGTTTLSAVASSPTASLKWYAASSGGSALFTGANFTTPTISITTDYWVEATENGCTTPSRTKVTATVNPRPTITSTTPNSFCNTSIVLLKGTSSAGTIRWYSVASGGSVLGTGTNYTTPSISATTTYYAEAFVGTSCASSSRTAVVATRYTGAPSVPNANNPANIPTGPTSLCPPASGLVYTIPANMTLMTKDASTYYKWVLPAGFVITSGDSTSQITVSVAGPGAIIANNQNITVTAFNPCGNSITSRALAVNVNNFAGIDAGPDQNVCAGTTIALAASYSGNTSSSTWSLSPNGSFSSVNSPISNFTPSISTGTITLTITTNDPSGVCNAASDNVVLTMVQPSVAPVSLVTSAAAICNGSSITLTQTGGSLGTGATWKWYSNNTYTTLIGSGSGANASLSVSPTTTTTYYLRAESTTGAPCSANVAGPGAGVTVVVNQPSVAPTSLNASVATICKGSNTTLTQTGGSLGTGATWKWYSDNSFTTLIGTGSGSTASISVNPTATTTYYLRAESATGAPCAANVAATGSVTVVVNDPSIAPTAVQTSIATICNEDNITLTQSGGSLGTGATWQWYSNSTHTTLVGTGSGASASLTISPTTTKTYYLRAESTTGSPCAANVNALATVAVTVNQPSVAPTALNASATTICKGSSSTLTQTGGTRGTGATWQWYSDNSYTTLVGTGSGSSASLSVSPTTTTTYYLRAESSTNAPCIANVAATASVTVMVNEPSIAPTQLLVDNATVCGSGNVTLSQTGGTLGTGAVWKWYSNSSYTQYIGDGAGPNASLTINATVTDIYYLRAESTTGAPCTANVPGPNTGVKVTVNAPAAINTQPAASQTVCATFPVSFSVTANGNPGITYQWFKDGNPLSNGGTVSGATSSTLSISQAALSDAGTYTVVVSGVSPCGTVTSTDAVLTVDQVISITSQPVATAVCSGTDASFSVTATNGVTYQWRRNGVPVSGGAYSGENTPNLSITGATATEAGNYDVVISTAGGGCSQAISTKAALTINPLPAGTISGGTAVCLDGSQPNITFTGSAGTAPYTFTYKINTGSNQTVQTTAGNSVTVAAPTTTSGSFDYTLISVSDSKNCSQPQTGLQTITVNPLPAITPGSSATAVCYSASAQTTSLSYSSPVNSPTTYSISWNNSPANSFAAVNNASLGSSPLTINVPAGTVAGTYTGSITVKNANGCSSPAPVNFTITVNPIPTVTSAATATICTNVAQNYSITSGVPGTTFTWSRNAVSGISNAAVTGQTSATITETLINTSSAAINVPYTITPSANGCSGPAFTYTVTVNPQATLTLSSGANTNNLTVCQGLAASPAITYVVAGTTNTPSVSGLPAGMNYSYNTSSKVLTINGTPTASGTFNYTATVTGACGNATATGTITVNPAAVGGTTARTYTTPFVCAGDNNGAVNLTGQSGNVVKWQRSTNNGVTWTDISNTTTTQPFTNISATTTYRAVIATTQCPGILAYSTSTTVSVIPQTGQGSLTAFANPTVICTGSSTLTAMGLGSGGTIGGLSGGDFDNAGAGLEGPGLWRKTINGLQENIEASTNNTLNSPFNLTNGPKTFIDGSPCSASGVTLNNDPLGGQSNNNKFMAVVGPNTSSLETPIFTLAGLTTANLSWWEYFQLQAGASIKMELSFDGGNTYTQVLKTITGTAPFLKNGSPTNFTPASLNLDAFVGLSNLRVKFTYTGSTCSLWGMEMARITTGAAPASFYWSLVSPAPTGSGSTPPDHYLDVFQNPTVVVSPPSPNTTNAPIVYNYSLSTTSVSSTSGSGCIPNISVTVNPVLITSATNPNSTALCSGSSMSAITFNANVTGTSFSWSRTNGTLTTGNVTGLAASGTGSTIPSATLINTTTTVQTVTFTITPTNANACSPAPFTTTITINPNIPIAISGGGVICGPGTAPITLTSAGPFPVSLVVTNGTTDSTINMTGSPFTFNVRPSASATYTIKTLMNSNCATLAGSGSALVSVSAGSSQPIGTWVGQAPCGGSGSDWFNPCNWGGGVVPTLTTDVLIDAAKSVCNPIIDPTTSYAIANGPIALSKNITITGSGKNLSFANGGELQVAGNWVNQVGPTGFTAGTGTVAFVGNAAQSITTTAGQTETFYKLTITNTSAATAGVTLNSNVLVSNTLTLNQGIVNTKSVPPSGSSNGLGLLTMGVAANAVAGSPGTASFINGQMAKQFNTSGAASEYLYPVGKIVSGTPTYKAMAIQPTTNSGNTTFVSEYFPTAHPIPTVVLGAALVGTVPEYWQVDQVGGNEAARIKIPYQNPGTGNWLGNDNAGVPDPCSSCNVAVVRKDAGSNGWDFTQAAGNFNTSDPETRFHQNNGFIYSAPVTSFGPFTNGYAYNVILPVKLITFDAKLVGVNGNLSWTIDDAKDLAGFELQYSKDGRTFAKLTDVKADPSSTSYRYLHESLAPGSNYYRLLVKDKNGTAFYSKTLMLIVIKDITIIKGMRPTMVRSNTYVDIYAAQPQVAKANLLDISGRTLAQYKMTLVKGENHVVVDASMLVQGTYTLHVITEDGVVANLRFVKE